MFLPTWDGHFWDGRPVVIKIEDLDEFKLKNGVRVRGSTCPDGSAQPVVEVTESEGSAGLSRLSGTAVGGLTMCEDNR